MNLPSDLPTWLKLVGALTTAFGSLLLAWRIRAIMKWVVYCLVAHEISIEQLGLIAQQRPQTEAIVKGVTNHLLDVESKLGGIVLVRGCLSLGIGMLANAAVYLVGTP